MEIFRLVFACVAKINHKAFFGLCMKARCSCYTNYAGHVRINKQGQERPRQSKGHWNFTKSIKNLNQFKKSEIKAIPNY